MLMATIGTSRDRKTHCALVALLCFLEPAVLRSQPDIFRGLRWSLGIMRAPGNVESAYTVGQRAWNERCEAQGLGEGCDTETRESKLKAMLHSGVRGCFVRLSALGTPVGYLWSGYKWTPERLGHDVFPAVYH